MQGKFDAGWDTYREETFARQKQLGVISGRREADAAPQGNPGLG